MHKLAQGEARIVECSGRDPEKKANFLDQKYVFPLIFNACF